jgi:hypothetical protein
MNKKNSHVPLYIVLVLVIMLGVAYFLFSLDSNNESSPRSVRPLVIPTISEEELAAKRLKAESDKKVYSSMVNGKLVIPK